MNQIHRKNLLPRYLISEKFPFWLGSFSRLVVFLLLLSGILAKPLLAAQPICLRCHPSHHAELGTCNNCHRGNDRAARKQLAHHDLIPSSLASFALNISPARERGEKLAALLACRRCHTLEHRGNRLASDLDQVVATSQVTGLRQAVQTPAWYMPDFRLAPGEMNDLLTYVLFAGKSVAMGKSKLETPLVIHFADDQSSREDPFSRHCGGCHMTLTERMGGLGRGRVAPNLAGLLGEQYPMTYRRKEPWTPATLSCWLANPRTSRPLTMMPPIRLQESAFTDLVRQIEPSTR